MRITPDQLNNMYETRLHNSYHIFRYSLIYFILRDKSHFILLFLTGLFLSIRKSSWDLREDLETTLHLQRDTLI